MSYCDFYSESEEERAGDKIMETGASGGAEETLTRIRIGQLTETEDPVQILMLCRNISLAHVERLSLIYRSLCGMSETMTIIDEWQRQTGEDTEYLSLFSDYSNRIGFDLIGIRDEISEVMAAVRRAENMIAGQSSDV